MKHFLSGFGRISLASFDYFLRLFSLLFPNIFPTSFNFLCHFLFNWCNILLGVSLAAASLNFVSLPQLTGSVRFDFGVWLVPPLDCLSICSLLKCARQIINNNKLQGQSHDQTTTFKDILVGYKPFVVVVIVLCVALLLLSLNKQIISH